MSWPSSSDGKGGRSFCRGMIALSGRRKHIRQVEMPFSIDLGRYPRDELLAVEHTLCNVIDRTEMKYDLTICNIAPVRFVLCALNSLVLKAIVINADDPSI